MEGQTEERFVKDVLAPAYWSKEIFFTPTILITKRVKEGAHFKGGVTTYGKFENDIRRLLAGSRGALVTTLIDYYGLPTDFPGMNDRPLGSPRDRVIHVESAITQDLGSPSNFIPFLLLHEFEAMLFSSIDVLPRVMTQIEHGPAFAAIRSAVPTPEDINEKPENAPSKRIERLFPAYKKTLHGPVAAARIGLEAIKSQCSHFSSWLQQIEQISATH